MRIEILISKLILTFLKYLQSVPNYFEESWSSDFLKFSSKFRHVEYGKFCCDEHLYEFSVTKNAMRDFFFRNIGINMNKFSFFYLTFYVEFKVICENLNLGKTYIKLT